MCEDLLLPLYNLHILCQQYAAGSLYSMNIMAGWSFCVTGPAGEALNELPTQASIQPPFMAGPFRPFTI